MSCKHEIPGDAGDFFVCSSILPLHVDQRFKHFVGDRDNLRVGQKTALGDNHVGELVDTIHFFPLLSGILSIIIETEEEKMRFQWDEEKNRSNQKKHHISFEYASYVFDDEYLYEEYDAAHSDDEDRYDVIGMVDDIIFVVCTYRDNDIVRLISARKANRAERRKYYGNRDYDAGRN